MPIRLQKLLSAAGVASRRVAETLIAQGRVTVNGRVVSELGAKADPERDEIRVDGRRVRVDVPRRYYLLNKPRGYVCTRTDPQGRPTIVDLLRGQGIHGYLYPVGRLDYDSEGLLVVTNDGDLAAHMTHPRHGVEREYEVRVRGVPGERALERLRRGVLLEGRQTAPAGAAIVATLKAGDQALLVITLREGRKRQVRHMCELIGHPVIRLRRLRIGPIRDARLAPGHARPLTSRELEALRQLTVTATAPPSRSSPAPIRPSRSAVPRHRRA